MSLAYGSVCSGIEAATVAWHPLGWQPQFFSEIEAAPRAVLTHRWPGTPLHGDFTTIRAGEYGPIDLLVGGTPCQSFSVAGLRGGLADDRGNLALEYLRLAQRLRPRWLVWENVPGVLSSNGGRDFGAILGGMVELGYGFAYRVLDAQHVRVDGFGRAVPQRRRRVFVVGHLGDWRRPAAVLLERACLRGDPAPRREAGQRIAGTLAAGSGGGCGPDDNDARAHHLVAEPAGLPVRGVRGGQCGDMVADVRVVRPRACGGGGAGALSIAAPFAPAISASNPYGDHESREGPLVAHTLLGGGHSTNPMEETLIPFQQGDSNIGPTGAITGTLPAGNGNESGGVPCIAFSCKDHGADATDEGATPTLRAMGFDRSHANAGGQLAVAQPIAFHGAQDPDVSGDVTHPVGRNGGLETCIGQGWAVRRLTPRECERLQGFPDDFTAVPWRGGLLPDGPRYKALGNSMAANVMRWIGRRIEMVERIGLSPLPSPTPGPRAGAME